MNRLPTRIKARRNSKESRRAFLINIICMNRFSFRNAVYFAEIGTAQQQASAAHNHEGFSDPDRSACVFAEAYTERSSDAYCRLLHNEECCRYAPRTGIKPSWFPQFAQHCNPWIDASGNMLSPTHRYAAAAYRPRYPHNRKPCARWSRCPRGQLFLLCYTKAANRWFSQSQCRFPRKSHADISPDRKNVE